MSFCTSCCRICLWYFTDDNEKLDITESTIEALEFIMQRNMYFIMDTKICTKCDKEINYAFNFCKKIKATEDILHQNLQSYLQNNVKDIIGGKLSVEDDVKDPNEPLLEILRETIFVSPTEIRKASKKKSKQSNKKKFKMPTVLLGLKGSFTINGMQYFQSVNSSRLSFIEQIDLAFKKEPKVILKKLTEKEIEAYEKDNCKDATNTNIEMEIDSRKWAHEIAELIIKEEETFGIYTELPQVEEVNTSVLNNDKLNILPNIRLDARSQIVSEPSTSKSVVNKNPTIIFCPYCIDAFNSYGIMFIHCRLQHRSFYKIKCTDCFCVFSSAVAAKCHKTRYIKKCRMFCHCMLHLPVEKRRKINIEDEIQRIFLRISGEEHDSKNIK